MSTAERLLARAGECGFSVELHADAPKLVPVRSDARCPPDLLAEMRRYRQQILALLLCEGCGRVTCSREDRDRLRDPLHCDNGACPYKRNRQ